MAAQTADDVITALLKPPLFQQHYDNGYGTLYTAGYFPATGQAELIWPDVRWKQDMTKVSAGMRTIRYPWRKRKPCPPETAIPKEGSSKRPFDR